MKKLAFAAILALALSMLIPAAAAYPSYSNRCAGCTATYYTHHPYTHYYYGSYVYGYNGWGWDKVHYHYRYPYYRHYYPYKWHYPYAYNYYPNPMYRNGAGYGPGIIW